MNEKFDPTEQIDEMGTTAPIDPILLNDDTKPTMLVPGHTSGLNDMVRRDNGLSEVTIYQLMPAQPSNPNGPRWQIEFHFENAAIKPLCFEVADSAVMGRGHAADIPLDGYDDGSLGISRQHAMLRPSQRTLYFIDLSSRNGSYHNGVKIGSGSAVSLTLGDVIRLGRFTLTIRHLQRVTL